MLEILLLEIAFLKLSRFLSKMVPITMPNFACLRQLFRRQSKSPNINELSDLPLLYILDHLPLQTLLLVRSVNQRWNFLATKTCLTRRSLTLLAGPCVRWFQDTHLSPVVDERNILKIECSKVDLVQLSNLMPNVTSLEITLFRVDTLSIDHIIGLLQTWPLVTFRCAIVCNEKIDTEKRLELLNSLNNLPSLRHLKLVFFIKVFSGSKRKSFDFPVLSQLHSFSFFSNDNAKIWLDSLKQYATENVNLQQIELDNFMSTGKVADFLKFDRRLHKKITTLYLNNFSADQLAHRFQFLNTIRLTLEVSAFLRIFPELAQLPQLKHVKLWFYRLPNQNDDQAEFDNQVIVPLKTVTRLNICLSNYHMAVEQLPLKQIFPAVSKIVLQCFQCDTCRYDCKDDKSFKGFWTSLRYKKCRDRQEKMLKKHFPNAAVD